MKIGVIFGGKSGEYEISLMSATSVINAIDKNKYEVITIGITKQGDWYIYDGPVSEIESGGWLKIAEEKLKAEPEKYQFSIMGTGGKSLKDIIDFALPILHGPNGEDGTVQGLFEMVGIPYGGCGVLGSSVAMDKCMAKELFQKAGLPVCKHVLVEREKYMESSQEILADLEEKLGYPMFVKPSNMGSSVGISKAKDRAGLIEALDLASIHDRRLIVEESIDGRELETGVLGNYNPKAAAVGEIIASQEFYDYKAKYFDDGKSKMCIPADIPKETSDQVRDIAVKAFKELDCAGYARVDFFMEKKSGKVLINEVNTIPGFTKFSMFPSLWAEAGVPYSQLIERIIELGYERYNVKNNR